MREDTKVGFFFKDENGRTVFAGGPGSGAGGTSKGAITFATVEEADAYAMKNLGGSNLHNLSEDQTAALSYYVGNGYIPINKALRKDKVKGEIEELVNQIDMAIDSSGYVKESFVVKRTYDMGFFNDKPVGHVFEDRGFVSTSIDPNYGHSFGVTVIIPKYARALYVKPIGMDEESEVLLGRGARYEVLQNDINGKVVRMIP